MFKPLYSAFILLITSAFSVCTFADVVINGTRIVFNAGDKEAVVQLKNNGKQPYLLQLWIDDGNPKSRPGEANVPFVITPPVARIDPARGQAVRIMTTASVLPQDRESLYWFNLLEVPPKPSAQDKGGNNLLQLAFRTRIKLFYRPDNLTPKPLQAYKELTFSRQGDNVQIMNDSPYYITLNTLDVRESKNSEILASVKKFPQRMIAPKGNLTLPLTITKSAEVNRGNIFYSVINDYGGESTNEQSWKNKK